jgi:hypothetical protein
LWLGTVALLFALLAGCGSMGVQPVTEPFADLRGTNAGVAAATFDSEGRLWRVVIAGKYLYVDHSADYGITYSRPIAVNPEPHFIIARPEDRPSIAVDRQGRIFVLYASDWPQMGAIYFSYSEDKGRSFSQPVLISEKAAEAEHYQGVMAVDPEDRLYILWNDDRNQGAHQSEKHGAMLYSALVSAPEKGVFPNRKVTEDVCNCCRLAMAMDTDNLPAVLARFVFPDNIRDHGLFKMTPTGLLNAPQRVTNDKWHLKGCPRHGPAFSIAENGRYHIAWFTQGEQRQGLFYAYSDDQGKHFSVPLAIGNEQVQVGHPALLALGERTVLVWQEYDGKKTRILAQQSHTGGEHWSPAREVASSEVEADYPFLLTDRKQIFLSWNSQDQGYQLIPLFSSEAQVEQASY